ncbi:MAG: WbqC family protein [Alphaproteobacteria bacterium]
MKDTPTVAIHQPNHLPWLGYFRKVARADVFVFLDDAQFSKGSYINRVRVLAGGRARWLTVPVSASLGQPICRTMIAPGDWRGAHRERLRAYYRDAPHFDTVFPVLAALVDAAAADTIADANIGMIRSLADRLGLAPEFRLSSQMGCADGAGDARLAALVAAAGGRIYLSGGGGAKYQDETTFARSGIALAYNDTQFPAYDQGGAPFVPGLSVVDALFRIGFAATARLIRGQ